MVACDGDEHNANGSTSQEDENSRKRAHSEPLRGQGLRESHGQILDHGGIGNLLIIGAHVSDASGVVPVATSHGIDQGGAHLTAVGPVGVVAGVVLLTRLSEVEAGTFLGAPRTWLAVEEQACGSTRLTGSPPT